MAKRAGKGISKKGFEYEVFTVTTPEGLDNEFRITKHVVDASKSADERNAGYEKNQFGYMNVGSYGEYNDSWAQELRTESIYNAIAYLHSDTDDYGKPEPLYKAIDCKFVGQNLSREDLTALKPVLDELGHDVVLKTDERAVKVANFGTPMVDGEYSRLDYAFSEQTRHANRIAELDADAKKFTDEQLGEEIESMEHRMDVLRDRLAAMEERLAAYRREKDARLESSAAAAKKDRGATVDSDLGNIVDLSQQVSAEADITRPGE